MKKGLRLKLLIEFSLLIIRDFTHSCDEVALNPSQAIKLIARTVINYDGNPFELKAKQPDAVTATTIQELSLSLNLNPPCYVPFT